MMKNYIFFLMLMMCSAAFPQEIVIGGEKFGIKKLAEDVRDGKIERIKIKRESDGRLSIEVSYGENYCAVLLNENNTNIEAGRIVAFLFSGNKNSDKSIFLDKNEFYRDRKEANMVKQSIKINDKSRFTSIFSVYDFSSRRRV